MVVALLQFELTIPHAESLKDKRRVVKSLKDRLHREHLVSIAEVASLDDPRRAGLAAALVSADARYASGVLDAVIEKVRHTHEARLGVVTRQIIHGSSLEWDESDDEAQPDPAWLAEEARMARAAEDLLKDDLA